MDRAKKTPTEMSLARTHVHRSTHACIHAHTKIERETERVCVLQIIKARAQIFQCMGALAGCMTCVCVCVRHK